MSEIEKEAINQLVSNLKDDSKSSTKIKKKPETLKNCCIAAVKYNTIGEAYKDHMKGLDVYLVKEEKNGSMKTNAFSRCSKTSQEGKQYCHLHTRMITSNPDGLKIYERDILPKNESDKTRYIANVNDDFFENMGKRGAKKKNGDNNYQFPTENHPILLILNHKNPKLMTHLTLYASQLLKKTVSSDEFNKLQETPSIVNKEDSVNNLKNLIRMIPELQGEVSKHSAKEKVSVSDDSDEESDEDAASDAEESDADAKEESDTASDAVSDAASDDGSEEEVSCIPIYTKKDKLLWYNPENNFVYEPEGNDGGEEIGILTQVKEKYATVVYNDEHYTVLKNVKDPTDKASFYCTLTNSMFDKNMKYIGKHKTK
jgi:hypothetical protein